MSYITKFINENYNSFEELKFGLTKAPYYLNVKEDVNLYMLCFTDLSDLTLKEVRDCTGIILEKETNQVVHFSFPKCYEGIYNPNSFANILKGPESFQTDLYKGDINSMNNSDDSKFTFNLFFIGSIIKLYFYNDGWHIGTSKNLNAENSFWSSKKSFETLFVEAVEESGEETSYTDFVEKLDPNYCYSYLLQHPENNCIVNVSKPFIFILNKVNTTSLREIIPDKECFVVSHKTVQNCNYLIYEHDKHGNVINRIKVLNKDYELLKHNYGNYPNIGLRYIECKMQDLVNNTKIDCDKLRLLFPNETLTFNKIDILFEKTCLNILRSYYNIFVVKRKTIKDIPKSQIKIVKKIEKILDDNMAFKVTRDTIDKLFYTHNNIREIAYMICYIY